MKTFLTNIGRKRITAKDSDEEPENNCSLLDENEEEHLSSKSKRRRIKNVIESSDDEEEETTFNSGSSCNDNSIRPIEFVEVQYSQLEEDNEIINGDNINLSFIFIFTSNNFGFEI